MKPIRGFNLVELMVALGMSALLLSLLSSSYAAMHTNFVYLRQQLALYQDLRFSLGVIKRDLQNAGVFGSFSLHNQAAGVTSECVVEWCHLDSVGVKSYPAANNPLLKVLPAARLDPASDILQLQYGGAAIADLKPVDLPQCRADNTCMINQCHRDQQRYLGSVDFTSAALDSNSRVYFLASANHGYLLNFRHPPLLASATGWRLNLQLERNSGCVIPGNPYVLIESALSGAPKYNFISQDPDMSSMQLMNFYTRYYFVAQLQGINGLYVLTVPNNGQLAAATLVSAQVTQLKLAYQLNLRNRELNNYPSLQRSYAWCSSAELNGQGMCAGEWRKISAVRLSLEAKTALNACRHSDSVAW